MKEGKMVKKGEFQGIIFAWGIDSVPNEQLNTGNIIQAEDRSSRTMMNLMKKLNDSSFENNPEIWIKEVQYVKFKG